MTKSALHSLFHDSSQLCSAPLKPPTPVFWGHRKNRNNLVWALGLSTHQQRWSACCCQRGTLSRKEVKAGPGVTFLCRNIFFLLPNTAGPHNSSVTWTGEKVVLLALGGSYRSLLSFFFHLQNGDNNTNLIFWARAQLLQLCPMLYDPTNCSPPGSSVPGILQARILEWIAIPFSRGSSWPRDRTCVSCIGRWSLYHWATFCRH